MRLHPCLPIFFGMMLLLPMRVEADATGGYMISKPTWLGYMRLTQTGSNVTGYLQFVSAARGVVTRTKRYELHGHANGNHLALKLNGFFGYGGTDATAEVRGANISLEIADSSGHLTSYRFVSASVLTWNRALSNFESKTAKALTKARVVAQVARDKQQIDKTRGESTLAVIRLLTHLSSNLNRLAAANRKLDQAKETTKERLQTADSARARANQARNEAKTDHERFLADGLAFKAQTADYEVKSARYAENSIRYEIDRILDEIDSDKTAIATAKARLAGAEFEARAYGEKTNSLPDLGSHIAVVISASAQVRKAADLKSEVLLEIPQGTYIAHLVADGSSHVLLLENGQAGIGSKADFRLVSLADVGRKPVGTVAMVTALNLEVHKSQDAASATIRTLHQNDLLCVTGVEGDWCSVQFRDGSTGWIGRRLVHFTDGRVYQRDDGDLYQR